MNLTINGETREAAAGTMLQLLAELGIDPRKVAIEHNAGILPKAEYGTTVLADGDKIEIVHFVGGG